MLVLLALGGLPVWCGWRCCDLSFFDDRQIVLLRTPVKRKQARRSDGKD